jgi:endonuclease/exonuclease/phosphatase family metal-dependent hydrolase
VDPVVRRRRSPPWRAASLLATSAGCALILVLGGCSAPDANTGTESRQPSRAAAGMTGGSRSVRNGFALMQMNLCLSGLAGCYGKVAYPAALDEATARINAAQPDAVTLNEACRDDAAEIARRTGYRMRFSRVYYENAPLPCTDPGGRGLFGDAVLTKAPVARSHSQDFRAQSGNERRRWLCVTTRTGLDACTTHLSTRSSSTAAATNDAQCAELADLLATRALARTVAFGGDLNRPEPCAPRSMWFRTDSSARQAPGRQHVYGSRDTLRAPSFEVIAARHTDHDVLLVHARRVSGRDRGGDKTTN